MEKGKLGQTFKAKCMLGMKRGGGRIHVLPHENKGNKGPCLSSCLLDSLRISLRKLALGSLHLFSLTGNKIRWIPLPPRASKVLSLLPAWLRGFGGPYLSPERGRWGRGGGGGKGRTAPFHRPLPVLWVGTWGCRAWGLWYTKIAWVLLSVTVVMTSLTWVYDVNNHQASQCWLLTPALLGSEVASPWPWAGRTRAHRGDWSHWQLSELHRFLPVLLCKGCFHSWEPPAEKIGALNTYWRSSL